MAIITLDKYKTLAGISGTSQDDRIEALIPVVQDDVIAICNYDFGAGTSTEAWPVGMQIYVVQMIGYLLSTLGGSVGMNSETQGGYSYTKDAIGVNGYPVGVEKGLGKFTRVSAKKTQAATQFRDRRLLTLRRLAEGGNRYFVPGVPIDEANTVPYPLDPFGVE